MSQDPRDQPFAEPFRIGVFYDRAFLSPLLQYYQHHHQMRRRIDLEELHEAVRRYASADYVPLVDWLVEDHVRVVVPHVHLTFPSRAGHPQCLATAPRLLERVTHTPVFDDLLSRVREFGGERS